MAATANNSKRKRRRHVVRIVVVDGVAAKSSRGGHGLGEAHGLTDHELKMGKARLKKMAAPPPSDPTTKKKKKNMLEALKPTDIVVMGVEAASVRVFDKKGKAVPPDTSGDSSTLRLFAHDDRHKDTVLRIWTNSDTVEYRCDRKFEIVKVERANWKIHGSPPNLFKENRGRTPYKATEERTTDASGEPKSVWKWTSGVVPASANNQQYKMTFEIGGKRVDPDVVCGDPPPSP